MKKQITFRTFQKYCSLRLSCFSDGSCCLHKSNKRIRDKHDMQRYGSCTDKLCPVWKRLRDSE